MKNQVGRHAHEPLVAHQELQEPLRALGVHGKLGENLLHCGNRKARFGEGRFDLFLCPGFLGLQHNLRARALHEFAGQLDLASPGKLFERGAKRLRPQAASQPRAQVFPRHAGQKRIGFVEPIQFRKRFCAE